MKNLTVLLLLVFTMLATTVNANTLPVTQSILEISKTPLAKWWRYMTPIEKRNFLRRLKQGNRIKTFTREEFKVIEEKRLLEWVEYRIKQDGGL